MPLIRSRAAWSTGRPERSQIPAMPHMDRPYISTPMARGRTPRGRAFLPGEGTLRDALQRLGLAAASRHRRRLDGTQFIGVTRSGGETTPNGLIPPELGAQ